MKCQLKSSPILCLALSLLLPQLPQKKVNKEDSIFFASHSRRGFWYFVIEPYKR